MNSRRRFLLDKLSKHENTKEKCIIETFDEFVRIKHLIEEDSRRQRLQKYLERLYEEKNYCKQCGRKITAKGFSVFCSDECRDKYYEIKNPSRNPLVNTGRTIGRALAHGATGLGRLLRSKKEDEETQKKERIEASLKRIKEKDAFETRKNNRDEHWKNTLNSADNKNKQDILRKHDAVEKIFGKENHKENERILKKNGLNDEQINKIEMGGFSNLHGKKGQTKSQKKTENLHTFHVTSSGGMGSRSNIKVTFNKDGKITNVGPHDDGEAPTHLKVRGFLLQ